MLLLKWDESLVPWGRACFPLTSVGLFGSFTQKFPYIPLSRAPSHCHRNSQGGRKTRFLQLGASPPHSAAGALLVKGDTGARRWVLSQQRWPPRESPCHLLGLAVASHWSLGNGHRKAATGTEDSATLLQVAGAEGAGLCQSDLVYVYSCFIRFAQVLCSVCFP